MKFLIILLICKSDLFHELDTADACKMKYNGSKVEMIDSVQFMVSFYSNLDIENKECFYYLNEDFDNIVPKNGVNRLFIIYVNENKNFQDYSFKTLFNSEIKKDLLKQIKAVYIYDVISGNNKLYTDKSEILKALRN